MKFVIALIVVLLTACASKPSKTALSTDTSTPIRVTGIGTTSNNAKQDGFAKAIQFVVGTVVVTESESSLSKLQRDDIIEHSSGYVDTYTVINETGSNGKVYVVMDVYIKHSQLANRILNKDTDMSALNSDKLGTQYATYLNSRRTLNEVFQTVLKDYPKKAFTVSKVNSEFLLDRTNSARLLLKYKMVWNYEYLTALNEMFAFGEDKRDANLFQNQIVVLSKRENDWVGKRNKYHFNDDALYTSVYDKLTNPAVVYVLLRDPVGKIVKCQTHTNNLVMGGSYLLVDGSTTMQPTMDISITPNELSILNGSLAVEFGVTDDVEYCRTRS